MNNIQEHEPERKIWRQIGQNSLNMVNWPENLWTKWMEKHAMLFRNRGCFRIFLGMFNLHWWEEFGSLIAKTFFELSEFRILSVGKESKDEKFSTFSMIFQFISIPKSEMTISRPNSQENRMNSFKIFPRHSHAHMNRHIFLRLFRIYSTHIITVFNYNLISLFFFQLSIFKMQIRDRNHLIISWY